MKRIHFLLAAAMLFCCGGILLSAEPVRKVVMASGGASAMYRDIALWTGKKDPAVLVIAAAVKDNPGAFDGVRRNFSPHTKNISFLKLFQPEITPQEMRSKILTSDIIWVCGGNTEWLMERWNFYFLDEALLLAVQKGTVLCGSSAGGICWSYAGFNDFTDKRYDLIRGIACEKVYFCPHYPGGHWGEFDKRLEEETDPSLPAVAFAVGNGAAVFFQNGVPEVRSYSGAKVYRFDRKDGVWQRSECHPANK